MTMASGAQARLIYAKETSFGVTPNPVGAIDLPYRSETLTGKRQLIKSTVIRSNRNPVKPRKGNLDVSGSIATDLDPFMGTILKHIFGSATTTGEGTNKTHTFKIGSLPTGLTIEKGFQDVGRYLVFNGCKVNKANMKFGASGQIPLSIDLLGRSVTVANATIDENPTSYEHDAWDMFEATLTEGGASLATASSIDLTITNECDGNLYVIGGGGLRRAIPEGSAVIEGTLSVLFEDVSMLQKAISFQESSLIIDLSRGTGDGSAGNEAFNLTMSELIYGEAYPVISGPKGILYDLPFVTYYRAGAGGSSIVATLKNTQATV